MSLDTLLSLRTQQHQLQHQSLGAVDIPLGIKDWFSRITLLKGMPITYLIPNIALLPPESIRFFYIDHNWIRAAAAGAFSIGHHSHDPQNYKEIDLQENEVITGVLIHSALVRDFPRTRIKGFDINNKELPQRRDDKIGVNIRILFFSGELEAIQIFSPQEAIALRIEKSIIKEEEVKDDAPVVDENGVLLPSALNFESSEAFVERYTDIGNYVTFKKSK